MSSSQYHSIKKKTTASPSHPSMLSQIHVSNTDLSNPSPEDAYIHWSPVPRAGRKERVWVSLGDVTHQLGSWLPLGVDDFSQCLKWGNLGGGPGRADLCLLWPGGAEARTGRQVQPIEPDGVRCLDQQEFFINFSLECRHGTRESHWDPLSECCDLPPPGWLPWLQRVPCQWKAEGRYVCCMY